MPRETRRELIAHRAKEAAEARVRRQEDLENRNKQAREAAVKGRAIAAGMRAIRAKQNKKS
jgi:hypothetical protein